MINIGEIVRETMPSTLWSNVIGKRNLKKVDDDGSIRVDYGACDAVFSKYGEFMQSSKMCNIFPSEKMQDWSKFAWKKGDVLIRRDEWQEEFCIFDSFTDDEYDTFMGKFHNEDEPHFNEWNECADNLCTVDFHKASDKETNEIIKEVERHYGGTLDLSTLEIVKTETVDTTNKKTIKEAYKGYVFKPKEWCLMQTIYFPQFSTKSANNPWTLCQFSHMYGSFFIAVGGKQFEHCIPYNDETAHLLGTTDNWEGGGK